MNIRSSSISIVVAAVLFILISYSSYAQDVPNTINYQGKLTNSAGQQLPDGDFSAQFKLYTVVTGGTPFWTSSTQTIPVKNGTFSTTLSPLTASDLAGKTDIYLEVTIGSEVLSPRTRFTSTPFSLMAGSIPDKSLALNKIDTSGAVTGQVLIFNGSEAGWGTPAGSDLWVKNGTAMHSTLTNAGINVTSPASALDVAAGSDTTGAGNFTISGASNSNSAVSANTSGTGHGGNFLINNASNSSDAMHASTNGSGNAVYGLAAGTGRAGCFQIGSASNDSDALYASTSGSGNAVSGVTSGIGCAGYFIVSNASNNNNALIAYTTGNGSAIQSSTVGGGPAGRFYIGNTSNNSNTLHAATNGTGNAVYGLTTGTGRAACFQVYNKSNSSHALEVDTNGTSDAGTFQIDNTSNSGTGVYANSNGTGNSIYGYMSGTGNAGYFQINNSSNNACALLSSTNGTRDACHAEVNNTANGGSGVFASSNGKGWGVFGYMSGTGTAGYFQNANISNNNPALECSTNGNGYALKATGFYAAKLDGFVNVSRGLGVGTPASSNYIIDANGTIHCIGVNQSSDARFKKNIETLTDSLDKIIQLRGVSFDWRKDEYPDKKFSDGKQIGFIAQEVEKVFPELVSHDDRGYLSVNYSAAVPVLVEAMKSQQIQINGLEKKNADLENRLANLEKAFAAMQKN